MEAQSETLGWARRLRRALFPRRHVLVVPPGPPGGVGDEAVTQMLAHAVYELGATKLGVVTYDPRDDWGLPSLNLPVELVAVPTWPFDRARWAVASVHAALAAYDRVLIAGNDCIDGGYSSEGTIALLDLARFVDAHGCGVAFVNCSYNARPTTAVVEALRALPGGITFWFRDELSAASFARTTGRPVHVGSEIAFLVQPTAAPDCEALAWVRARKAAGKTVVVLVPNPMVGTADPLGSPQRHPAPYVEVFALASQLRPGATSFLVIPNDARPAVGDLELVEAITAALPAALRPDVLALDRPLPAPILTELLRHVDVLVGARFHAVVMALVAGTPIVGLEYQDKMRGVLRACGLEEFWVPCEQGLSPSTIVARVAEALRDADHVRTRIGHAVPTLRRGARAMVEAALGGGR